MILTESLPPVLQLALAYAPVRVRPAWLGVMALDVRLAEIVRHAREPMLGQIRLAWWRDLLSQDPAAWPEGEPLVRHIADHLGEAASQLADLATAWEYLLSDQTLGHKELGEYLAGRARAYATVSRHASRTSEDDSAAAAATWWVMGDTFSQLSNEQERAHLLELAETTECPSRGIARTARPLAVLAALGERAVRRREPMLEGRGSALLALRVGMFGR